MRIQKNDSREMKIMEESKSNDWDSYWSKRKKQTFFTKLQDKIHREIVYNKHINLAVKYSKKGTIIDFGSGIAEVSILLAEKRGDKIIAVDFSDNALHIAKDLAKRKNIGLKAYKHNINKEFHHKKVELCWNIGTIEHFKNPLHIINNMKALSNTVIVIIPMKHLFRDIYELFKRFANLHCKGYYHPMKKKELVTIFKQAGFKNIYAYSYFIFGCVPFLAVIGKL